MTDECSDRHHMVDLECVEKAEHRRGSEGDEVGQEASLSEVTKYDDAAT